MSNQIKDQPEQTTSVDTDKVLMQDVSNVTKFFTLATLKTFLGNIANLFQGTSSAFAQSGYRDLIGEVDVKGSGSSDPTWTSTFNGLFSYAFSATVNKEVFTTFHVDHDYKPGGNIFLHVHWMTIGTNAGTCRWGFEYSVAKGYNQGSASVFPATTTTYIEQVYSGVAKTHMVAELASSITLTNVEPDSLILCRVFRDASHANDTLTDVAFMLKCDAHYETDRVATKNRNPNFYT